MIKLNSAIIMPGTKYRKEQGGHDLCMVMHSLMSVVLGPFARVSKVRYEGALCWGSVLQCFPCLVKVHSWVAWGDVGCIQVVHIVEHRVVIDVTVGAFAFESAYHVAVDNIEAQEGRVYALSRSIGGRQLDLVAPAGGIIFPRGGPGPARCSMP
jgi:hypothetical protein